MPDSNTLHPSRLFIIAMRVVLGFYWLVLASLTHWPSLSVVDIPMRTADDPMLLVQHDKPIHMLVFAGLAVLLILAKPFGRQRSPRFNLLSAIGVAMAYAILDETTQGFAADRTVSSSDLLANLLGIVGVGLLALTPLRNTDAERTFNMKALLRLLGGLTALVLVGALLSITKSEGREINAIHFVAAVAITIALLRGGPVLPRKPRLSTLLVCSAMSATIALSEMAQGFSGLTFSLTEAFVGEIGLLLAMVLWTARLAIAPPPSPATQSPMLASQPAHKDASA